MFHQTFIGLKIYDSKLRRNKANIRKEYGEFFKYCDEFLEIELNITSTYSRYNIMGFSDNVIDYGIVKKDLLKLIKKEDVLKIESCSEP